MHEPIELYTSFDPHYFSISDKITDEEEREEEYERIGAPYKAVLTDHLPVINDVLKNILQPEQLPQKFYSKLTQLIQREIRYPVQLHNIALRPVEIEETFGAELTAEQQRYLTARTMQHIIRLSNPNRYISLLQLNTPQDPKNTVCSDFARDLTQYLDTTPDQVETITNILGHKGESTFAFWTLAPYLYLDLQHRDDQANNMDRLLEWITDSNQGDLQNLYTPPKVFKKHFGIKSIPQLGLDERMPSHLLIRIISKVISRELVTH